MKGFLIGMVSAIICASCATSGLSIKTAASWAQNADGESGPRLKAGFIRVDKPGGGLSVEREIAGLLPLVFLEQGFVFVDDGSPLDYVIDVRATERDFYAGWETRKSVSLEILMWPADRSPQNGEHRFKVETPLAAGRTVAQGNPGLSSSKNTEALLRRSVKELLKSLAKAKPEARDAAASELASGGHYGG